MFHSHVQKSLTVWTASNCSGWNPVSGSFEYGNEPLFSRKVGNIFSREKLSDFKKGLPFVVHTSKPLAPSSASIY
jgi:hypothetical protein